MQAMMLAAGMGSRLKDLTSDNTKCMLKIHGKTLIERALDALVDNGITKMILVIGYKGDNLKRFIGDNYRGMPIEYIENPIYDKTNNIYSLFLAKKQLEESDTLLLESDLIFDVSLIKGVLADSRPNLAVVAKFKSWMDGTVVTLDKDDNIIHFLEKSEFKFENVKEYFKTVNIYKFSKEFSKKKYIPFLKAYCEVLGHNEYYEQVLKVITLLDLKENDLQAFQIDREKWYEIDDLQDYNNAEALFADSEKKLELFSNRYGGYWRFPNLIDFCYLVNPYFPPRRMLDEMECYFRRLIAEYPSGQGVQKILAAKMFSVDTDQILVGNGAAEIIKSIMELQIGKVGFICPTFNEYAERVEESQREFFIPTNSDFSYSVDDLIEFSDKIDTLVLINPDNPSGHMISKTDVLLLAKTLNSNNKKLILDESFVDFSDDFSNNTCIDSKIFEEHANLTIIKSISKSYGVPGIRLGVVATSDSLFLEQIYKKLSIWNINSFGEFFLQNIGKYQNQYTSACHQIISERDHFYKELNKISFLRVIPSQANYFLCEVTDYFTATSLTKQLLNNHDLFIKDCTGKIGFKNREFVRIAIRNSKDNEKIINTLYRYI